MACRTVVSTGISAVLRLASASCLIALSACAQFWPSASVGFQPPNNSMLTGWVKSAWSLGQEYAEGAIKRKLRERFPDGMTVADAESVGFTCGQDGERPSCSYTAKVRQIRDGPAPANERALTRRLTVIEIHLDDPADISSMRYVKTDHKLPEP